MQCYCPATSNRPSFIIVLTAAKARPGIHACQGSLSIGWEVHQRGASGYLVRGLSVAEWKGDDCTLVCTVASSTEPAARVSRLSHLAPKEVLVLSCFVLQQQQQPPKTVGAWPLWDKLLVEESPTSSPVDQIQPSDVARGSLMRKANTGSSAASSMTGDEGSVS